jgi:hypothetical protein
MYLSAYEVCDMEMPHKVGHCCPFKGQLQTVDFNSSFALAA